MDGQVGRRREQASDALTGRKEHLTVTDKDDDTVTCGLPQNLVTIAVDRFSIDDCDRMILN